MKIKLFIIISFIACFLLSCADSNRGKVTLPDIDISDSPNGIVPLPDNTPSIIRDVFVKYTKIIAPNGKPIHFLAAEDWTENKLMKVRNVMEFMLTDFPDSEYGSDKTVVANTMADRKATMTLYNSSTHAREVREGPFGSKTDLFKQSMWANEITCEGEDDYMNHVTRDATYEEVWHLVHEAGVRSVLKEFQAEIEAAKDAAVAIGWGPPNDDPTSWHSEYYAQQLDNYLDLWVVQPKVWEGRVLEPGEMPEGTAHWGQNQVNSREELKVLDPVGYELVEKFFHPYLTYTPQLPVDFEGTFSLEFDESLVYTHKSQHLKDVILRGDNDANLVGNGYDNVFRGNAGDNLFRGGKGNDMMDGGGGKDTALFTGLESEYSVTRDGEKVVVKDKQINRDGVDTLTNMEILQFKNKRIKL